MSKVFKKVIIKNESGLHARPAAGVAQIAQHAISDIYIEKNGIRADAASIPDILSLFCPRDTEITVSAKKSEDRHVVDRIVIFISELTS